MPNLSSEDCWEIGDWALSLVPVGPAGVNSGALRALERIAPREGVSYRSLIQYRGVAHDWPPETRRDDVAFTVHDILRYEDDRFELIWSRADWTTAEAKEYVKTRPPKRPPQVCRICGEGYKAKGLCQTCYLRQRYQAQKEARPKDRS